MLTKALNNSDNFGTIVSVNSNLHCTMLANTMLYYASPTNLAPDAKMGQVDTQRIRLDDLNGVIGTNIHK